MSTVNNDRTALDPTAGTMAGVDARNKSAMAETEDRFLTMLITQLRNQDPLNPMDNAQVTTQMAQMSTVAGIQQLNNTLLAVAGQMDVSQSMQAANLIGKQVLVPGSKVSLGTSQDGEKVAMPYGIDLVSGATSTVVQIKDSSGKVVREYDLGAKDAGVYSLEWDGLDNDGSPLADGSYTVTASPLTHGKVDSVAYTSSGLMLDLGLAGSFSLLDIRKIM